MMIYKGYQDGHFDYLGHSSVNSETILIQWIYSDCIYATTLYLQNLGWYIGYEVNNPISFNSNWLGIKTLRLVTQSIILWLIIKIKTNISYYFTDEDCAISKPELCCHPYNGSLWTDKELKGTICWNAQHHDIISPHIAMHNTYSYHHSLRMNELLKVTIIFWFGKIKMLFIS